MSRILIDVSLLKSSEAVTYKKLALGFLASDQAIKLIPTNSVFECRGGMFMFSIKTMKDEFKKYSPDIAEIIDLPYEEFLK